ncbi:hypothetical protein MtrunA17_Chr3g0083691 [Medicago truncatula]|uniref:Uncharacterized protein n=1 Tax=Medicago truncatula TaxID=3880 RepID=A0A396ILY9_MEDTR|nr:hypothetical protein MtrunA17_Chr3g0083691 [Medicago truncatula]
MRFGVSTNSLETILFKNTFSQVERAVSDTKPSITYFVCLFVCKKKKSSFFKNHNKCKCERKDKGVASGSAGS